MTTDIRKGDLVKATKGERVVVGRAHEYRSGQGYLDIEDFSTLDPLGEWDIEVLDRPLPPIDEELRNEVTAIWRNPRHTTVAEALTAIIHHVTEHNNKESK